MNRSLILIAIFLLPIAVGASPSGDLKIKTRQTMGGATFENTTYIKGDRTRRETANGLSVTISQCSTGRDLTLNTAARTYTESESAGRITSTQAAVPSGGSRTAPREGGTVNVTTTLRDTGERKQIFGYTARRIQTKVVFESSADACTVMNNRFETDGWYIDADAAVDCGKPQGSGEWPEAAAQGCRDKFNAKTIGTARKGLAVFESTTIYTEGSAQPLTMTNEVIELSRDELDPSLFEVPEGYALVKDGGFPPATAQLAGTQSRPAELSVSANAPEGVPGTAPAPKRENVVRIGIADVKVTATGDSISPQDLSAAIRNSFAEYLKAPNIEVVLLESKLPAAAVAEAAGLQCDAVLFATAAHKKGGGGFGGMFGKVIAPAVGSVGIGQTGSTAGNVAGQAATYAIVNAGTLAANVKAKDELTLAIELKGGDGKPLLSKQYKRKARSNGEDVISQLIEEAATAIVSLDPGPFAR